MKVFNKVVICIAFILQMVHLANCFYAPPIFDGSLEILEPVELSGLVLPFAYARFVDMASPVDGLEAYLALGDPADACHPISSKDAKGTIVLLDRGNCEFYLKAIHARDAGAVGFLFSNVVDRALPSASWGVERNEGKLNIPGGSIPGSDGETLKKLLKKGVAVKVHMKGPYLDLTST